MDILISKAGINECEAVTDFYASLIDKIKPTQYYPKWEKGVYPADEYLENAVKSGQMYITLCGEKIIGAMVVNNKCADGYDGAKWNVEASENEVTVIHILCVLPEFSGKGVGARMVRYAIKLAQENAQKAIRLDVLEGNLPAERLYKSVGFKCVGSVRLFYECTGLATFYLYEYEL